MYITPIISISFCVIRTQIHTPSHHFQIPHKQNKALGNTGFPRAWYMSDKSVVIISLSFQPLLLCRLFSLCVVVYLGMKKPYIINIIDLFPISLVSVSCCTYPMGCFISFWIGALISCWFFRFSTEQSNMSQNSLPEGDIPLLFQKGWGAWVPRKKEKDFLTLFTVFPLSHRTHQQDKAKDE